MRAGYYILGSFGLSIASTLSYFYLTRDANPNASGLAGKDADKQAQEIVEHANEQWTLFEEAIEKNASTPAKSAEPDPATPAESTRSTVNEPPAKTELETERDEAKALAQKEVMRGKDYPYKLIVPAGWKILGNNEEQSVLSWQEEIFVFFETGVWTTTQREWAKVSIADLRSQYPDMRVIDQGTMEIDNRTWQEFFLREHGTVLVDPRELMLLTYGERKRGSYRVIISGKAHALDKYVDVINTLLRTFRFPPDNFQPDDVSSVRIYVDGERQYF